MVYVHASFLCPLCRPDENLDEIPFLGLRVRLDDSISWILLRGLPPLVLLVHLLNERFITTSALAEQ